MRHTLYIIALVALVSCGGAQKPKSAEQSASSTVELSPEQELQHILDHYWDGFDFDNAEALKELNREEIVYAISQFVSIMPEEEADSRMRELIRRASTSHDMLDYFYTVCEIVLHNPNSPLRNDEYYIPVLEELVASPLLDEYERIAPAYDLEIALKNRIGREATDFVYTLEDGSEHRLHDIKANYTILLFSNPECPLCGEIMQQIASSELLSVLMQSGVVKVLTLYPDPDIDHWRKYLDNIPAEWIRAYDKGQILTNERLYNLSAIPALYLLDSRKRVLVKDGTSVAEIENILMSI